jgi:hypothetical protein
MGPKNLTAVAGWRSRMFPPITDRRPLQWREIVASCDFYGAPAELPFRGFFAELFEAPEDPSNDEEKPMRLEHVYGWPDRIVEPIQGWNAYRNWGEDASLIEEWFDEGEALAESDIEVNIEEPDRWERALQWIRSLVVAARLRPA